MNIRNGFLHLFALGLGLAPLTALAAQDTAMPADQGLGGPAVPGLCLLSREAVVANAAVGKSTLTRLKQITDAAQAEVAAERRPIETDAKTFQAEAPKLSAEQRKTREQALGARLQAVRVKAEQRSREIDATRAKALQRVSAELQPVVAQVYKQHGCGLLVDRNSVLGGNMDNDLTAAVIKALDAKITTISFNRESLPQGATATRTN